MDLTDLKEKTIEDLGALANDRGITGAQSMKRSDLVLAILRVDAKAGQVRGSGVLEVLADGFGFLRAADSNYTPGSDDIYVSPSQIRRFHLRTGDAVSGVVRPPKESERYYALLRVEKINGLGPDERKKKLFDNLTPVYPTEILPLEHDAREAITRMIDLFAPLAKGQRALVLSPPRAGKSQLLRKIAGTIAEKHPHIEVLLVLIAERPEEITEAQRAGCGEVIASSLDDPPTRHAQVAELALEKAKRVAEAGGDAVLVVDSLSRLARAYAGIAGSSARAADPGVVHQCRRFFGTARKLEEGGSLTIIASANADASSPLDASVEDDLIESASSLIVLCGELHKQRVVPPFDLQRSETRNADRLLPEATITASSRLRRKLLKAGEKGEAIDALHDLFSEHADNASLLGI